MNADERRFNTDSQVGRNRVFYEYCVLAFNTDEKPGFFGFCVNPNRFIKTGKRKSIFSCLSIIQKLDLPSA